MDKSREGLQKEYNEANAKLTQYQYKVQRLENPVCINRSPQHTYTLYKTIRC